MLLTPQQNMLIRANEILQECYAKVPHISLRQKLDGITFKISSRMTRAAGKARPSTGEITLSLAFFADPNNFEKDYFNTVTHEIAHILSPPTRSYGSSKRSSHGPEWQAMHRRLGGTGERCHDLDLAVGFEKSNKQLVPCSCGCGQDMKLGATQYKRYLAGTRYRLNGHRI